MAKQIKKNEDIGFEDALSKLEMIVTQLEAGELRLEESLEKFAQGVALSQICLAKLSSAEDAIDKVLQQANGSIQEKPLILAGEGLHAKGVL